MSDDIGIWVEKYRPRTLKDIINQTEIVDRLKHFANTRSMPHLIFAGPPGTGKTTAALALAHDLFGDNYRQNMLELNASDTRGIDVIRTRVKDFARVSGYGEVPFKLMILDEADNMTADAQQALRRTMEQYTRNTRFILDCNYSSKIIEPIQSRTVVFRFTPLSNEDVTKQLGNIAKSESVDLTPEGTSAILYVAGGDMRKAINTLQAASAFSGSVGADVVYKVTGKARPEEIETMINLALQGEFIESREKLRELLIRYGLSGVDVIRQIHKALFVLDIPEDLRVSLADKTGEIDFRLTEGANEEIQLNALLAFCALLGSKKD